MHWFLTSPGPWFNIKMSSYQYRKPHCGDKMILRPSYLHNGISYSGKMSSLYWTSPQGSGHQQNKYDHGEKLHLSDSTSMVRNGKKCKYSFLLLKIIHLSRKGLKEGVRMGVGVLGTFISQIQKTTWKKSMSTTVYKFEVFIINKEYTEHWPVSPDFLAAI